MCDSLEMYSTALAFAYVMSALVVGSHAAGFCASTCDDGWIFSQETGSAYLFRAEFMNWFQASSVCRSLGATLVQVDDGIEQVFITKYLKWHPLDFNVPELRIQGTHLIDGTRVLSDNWNGTVVWSGMNMLHSEGVWRWQGSNARVTYTNWAPAKPNNYKRAERCVHFFANPDDEGRPIGSWNDMHCNVLGTFICEKKLY
jgi:hypothetical protein